MTGMETAALTRATNDQSAVSLKNWQRVRPCTVTSATPAASARRASSGALRLAWSQPIRIFSVTGTRTAPTTASINPMRVIEIAHQCAAGELAGDLAGRTAHVDVDDVGAEPFRDAGTLGHPVRFAPGKLHGEGTLARKLGPAQHVAALAHQFFAGDHLGDDKPRPKPVCGLPERQIRDARHRGQHHAVREADRADREARRGAITGLQTRSPPGS